MNEQVISVIKNALKSTSQTKQVGLKDLRIKMELTESGDNVKCFAMNGKEVLEDISWNKILGMKFMAFKSIIVNMIRDKMLRVASEESINPQEVNLRFYAVSPDGTPNMYLYENGKPIKLMDINKFI